MGTKSCIQRLKSGDRNTKLFHLTTIGQRRRNKIHEIKNIRGEWVHGKEGMDLVFKYYFTHLFRASIPEVDDMHKLVDNIFVVLSVEDQKMIDQSFTAKEVEKTVFGMGPLKALGPDGFPDGFYHKYWSIIGPSVTNYILEILEGERAIKEINHTYLVLIFKRHKPENRSHFRPISLCNVLHKMAATILANRLKQVLPKLISHHQAVFLLRKLISNNILISHKILHHMKTYKSKAHLMAIKMDLNKAYDLVEWQFLLELIGKWALDKNGSR